MICYRQADSRYTFFWEGEAQPAARWHGEDEGPVQYLADTPDGAWAEFLRHEEIVDPVDLAGVRRAIWAISTEEPITAPALPLHVLTGGLETYARCQAEARRLRHTGVTEILAPSAALRAGQAFPWHTQDGLKAGTATDGRVVVLFGRRPETKGWLIAREANPPLDTLDRVRHFAPQ